MHHSHLSGMFISLAYLMYTTGRLEAAVYGFSEDSKQLLTFWLSWWGQDPGFAKTHRPIFYLIGFSLAIHNEKAAITALHNL